MTRDDRTGETPVDIWPPYTAAERIKVEWMTDPRRYWPTRAELKDEREAETEAAEEARSDGGKECERVRC